MNEISLFAAFVMGLIGSGHCIVMCGGIASSLQLAAKHEKPLFIALAYNFGRLTSYAIAGMLVALLGVALAKQNTVFAHFLQILSGIFMCLLGLYLVRLTASLQWIEKIGKSLIWQHLVKFNRYFMPVDSYPKAFGYGALWGWLPCGLVYSALTWTLHADTVIEGALIMTCFALGTFPALLLTSQLSQMVGQFINHFIVRLVLGNLFVWYGIYLVIIATNKIVL
ncbi:Heavy-metal-associated domain (N-terminus) and membrane-bounded cytochrome biogenesis cycZ-like domain,possible membrane copper tolerance protein [Pseudoalteromonas luteoviolacea B = ATCC 29581]|nr:Heavy-metal-associated domain (N-terminus) and membrane-bounded cytochrome biogenesis cycZ-like domain,possible membrane copper tolerance protein [Pseudoalteromonas luteoviolacea B = ATCC 29581]